MESSTSAKSSVLPSGGGAMLMNPSDTAILLLDHQSGLFQTVKDIPVADLRRNVEMIARLATLLAIPVITTASEPAGLSPPVHARHSARHRGDGRCEGTYAVACSATSARRGSFQPGRTKWQV